ncbi:hypothetical protein DICVIV_08450 [Dictyocaulus viviparus]|uniref:Uncharacterized protein n=1 Tax=Dictyocaulus viviparus TaxID=29172 RepID=A0A0D8XP26_DICVI|nr:hypothetical protein DICVIV_08450 [Dictyocaulus viviparus]
MRSNGEAVSLAIEKISYVELLGSLRGVTKRCHVWSRINKMRLSEMHNDHSFAHPHEMLIDFVCARNPILL